MVLHTYNFIPLKYIDYYLYRKFQATKEESLFPENLMDNVMENMVLESVMTCLAANCLI